MCFPDPHSIVFTNPNALGYNKGGFDGIGVLEGGERSVIKDFRLADEMKVVAISDIGIFLGRQEHSHLLVDESFPSGYAIELRNRYGCGNTFFPQ